MPRMTESPAWLKAAEKRIQRYVCPIYENDREHPLVGSSVLVGARSSVLLITADHVLRDRGDLYLWGQGELIGLKGKSYRNREFDFAFIRLEQAIASKLENYMVVNLREIAVDDSSIPHALYGFAGFPETRNRPRGRALQRSSVVFLVEAAGRDDYLATHTNPETHVVAEFNRKKLGTDGTKGTVVGPNPRGLSGGGVWRVLPPQNGREDSPVERFVGIGISYDRQRQLMVGLRTSIILPAIAHAHPDLAPEIPVPQRIRVELEITR